MSRKRFFQMVMGIFLTLSIAQVGISQTTVEADITENTEWTAAGSPYIIDPDYPTYAQTENAITVKNGATLTIEAGVAGVEIQFKRQEGVGTYLIITGGAELDANGTVINDVLFTAYNSTTPGFWGCILFEDNEYGNATGDFDYCHIEYAGYDLTPQVESVGAVLAWTNGYYVPSVTITNSEIDNCEGWAVWTYTSIYELKMENCNIHHNDSGIRLYAVWNDSYVRHCSISYADTGVFLHGDNGRVCNNLIMNNEIGAWCQSFEADQYLANNVMCENDTAIYFCMAYGVDETRNNILVDNEVGVYGEEDVSIVYHCFNGNTTDFAGLATNGGNNIFEDPEFYNDPDDYHLLYMSPCINAGDPSAIYNDPDDSPNDMGVYGGEYAWYQFCVVIPEVAWNSSNITLLDTRYWIKGDITVSNGYDLTIPPGAELWFADETSITIESNSKLVAEGTGYGVDQRIVMSQEPWSLCYWNGIGFDSGADNSSIIEYAFISYCHPYAIYFNGVTLDHPVNRCRFEHCDELPNGICIKLYESDTDIDSCYFRDCYTSIDMHKSDAEINSDTINIVGSGLIGINIYGGTDWNLENNIIYDYWLFNYGVYINSGNGKLDSNFIDGVYNGIKIVDSSPKLQYNLIDNCANIGMWLTNGSQPVMDFPGANQDGLNRIADCDSNEIFINGHLYPIIKNGHNDFVVNLDECRYVIYSDFNYNTEYSYSVQWNWWGFDLTTPIAVRNHIYPADEDEYEISVDFIDDDSNTGYTASIQEDLLYEALTLETAGQYSEAYDAYADIVQDYPNEPEVITAFTRMFYCVEALEGNFEDLLADYEAFEDNISNECNLFYLERMKGRALRKLGEFDNALDLYNGILSSVSSLTDSVFVLVDIENTLFEMAQSGPGLCNVGEYGDPTTAGYYHWNKVEELCAILESAPDSPGFNNETAPMSFKLLGNYPNPFNATTRIFYNVPEVSEVNLTVYSVSGQEVYNLVNGIKYAGDFDVAWNATNFASGVYFVKLSIKPLNGGETLSAINKMLLIK